MANYFWNPRRAIVQLVALLMFVPIAVSVAGPQKKPRHALYAFCFDIHDAVKRDLPQQAAMLKKLGFDGAGHVGLEGLSERLSHARRRKLAAVSGRHAGQSLT